MITDVENKPHGTPMICPTCHNPNCFLDLDTPSGQEVKDNACWKNQHSDTWECTECMYK